MERLQNCWAEVSWNQDSVGLEVNSVLHRVLKDDMNDHSEELETMATRRLSLSAPPSSEDSPKPCVLNLTCQLNYKIVAIVTISESKHTEVYSDNNSDYCGTVRGQRLDMDDNDANRDDVMYHGEWTFDKPVKDCSVKFLSLRDKHQMWLYYVRVVLEQCMEPSSTMNSSSLIGSAPSIDMSQVRSLLGAMNQETDEKTERLMTSIEAYQKNQSAMYDDIHGLMRDSMASSVTMGTQGSKPSEAVGMLGMLSKLSLLQNTQQPSGDSLPSTPTQGRPMAPNLAGSMASMLGGSMGSMSDNGSDSDAAAMFSMLKNVCCEVTKMRGQDNQKDQLQQSTGNENSKDDENTTEKNTDLKSSGTPEGALTHLEARLMQRIDEAEQRIVNKFERRMTQLQNHLDNRLDAIMAMLGNRQTDSTTELEMD